MHDLADEERLRAEDEGISFGESFMSVEIHGKMTLKKKNNGVLNRNITGRGGNFQRIFLLQNRQHSASDHTGPTKKDTRPSVSLALHDKNCIFLFVFLIV